MTLERARQFLVATIAAGMLAAAGCSTGETSSLGEADTPAPPEPCQRQPEGLAQDGVNDEQGGSIPGIDPCDGPGN